MKNLVLVLVVLAIGVGLATDEADAYLIWRLSSAGWGGDANNIDINWTGEFNGYLFAGTSNSVTGGEMWRSPSGYGWYKTGADGFGSAANALPLNLALK